MRRRSFRRAIFDLTPMIDVIMILLFGTMINSKSLVENDVEAARKEAELATHERDEAIERFLELDRVRQTLLGEVADLEKNLEDSGSQFASLAARNEELEGRLEQVDQMLTKSRSTEAEISEERKRLASTLEKTSEERLALERRFEELRDDANRLREWIKEHDLEKARIGRAFGRLLLLSKKQRDKLAEAIGNPEATDEIVEEMNDDPLGLYLAARRIEEMQKDVTFVQLHLDSRNLLHVRAEDREKIFFARGRTPSEMVEEIRSVMERITFRSMVLILFSYEDASHARTVDEVERALRTLQNEYRDAFKDRLFRFPGAERVNLAPAEEKP